MRTRNQWAVLLLVLALTGVARAQKGDPATFFGGVSPKDMTFKPVDMSNVAAPYPTSGSKITLGGILQKFNIPFVGKTPPAPLPLPAPGQPMVPGTLPSAPVYNSLQPVQPIPARR
jgi:hypothetical protein